MKSEKSLMSRQIRLRKGSSIREKQTEIAPMVKDMERFAEKYSADPEEVLPKAGMMKMGKSTGRRKQNH